MSAAAEAYREAFLDGLEPEELLTVSEWADRHRILSGKAASEPGLWRTSRTPYLREIMDSLSPHDPIETVVLMKGAQIGATEVGNNWLGYVIDHVPGPMMYVMPTDTLAKRTSKQRIAPMIQSCPRLTGRVKDPRSRDSGNTILLKEFAGGALVITGANAGAGLRSMPARWLFTDEPDEYPPDVDGQGDPLILARTRTNAFRRNRKHFMPSTPTVKGRSRIESWYERGDKRVYEVPCPRCGHYQTIGWEKIHWDTTVTEDGKVHHPETVRLICEACGAPIYEHQKENLLEAGRWRPTATARDPRVRSYHLSALYSPLGWYSWVDAARDFLEANREKKRGNLEPLKAFTNVVLAETWEEEADDIDHSVLFMRRERYTAQVPAGACLLTAGADIQKDRIEVEVVAWSPDYESWSVDVEILQGDTDQPDVWEQLDLALAQTYEHQAGVKLSVAAAVVDARFKTSQVFEFCRTRQARRIWAGQGKSGDGRPLVSSPSAKRTGRRRRPVQVFTIGVDQVKSLVYSRLRLTDPGPGYCHFPLHPDYDEELFAQLTAERLVTRYSRGVPYRAWVKKRPRNEALDRRVYATAAIVILGDAALRAAARRLERLTGKKDDDEDDGSPGPRRLRRHARSSWATRWRR